MFLNKMIFFIKKFLLQQENPQKILKKVKLYFEFFLQIKDCFSHLKILCDLFENIVIFNCSDNVFCDVSVLWL